MANPNLQKTLGKLLTLIGILVGLLSTAMSFYFVSVFVHSPLAPIRATGNVVPWNDHGAYHYVRQLDLILYSVSSDGIGVAAFMVIVGLFLFKGGHIFDRT